MSSFRVYKLLLLGCCCFLLNVALAEDVMIVTVVVELEKDDSAGVGLFSDAYPEPESSEITLKAIRTLVRNESGQERFKTQFKMLETLGSKRSDLFPDKWQGGSGQVVLDAGRQALMNSLNLAPATMLQGTSGWSEPDFKLFVTPADFKTFPVPTLEATKETEQKRQDFLHSREKKTFGGFEDEKSLGLEDVDLQSGEESQHSGGSGGDDGGGGKKYRFNKYAAKPLAEVVKKPFTSIFAAIAMATSNWLFDLMTASDEDNDRKVAAERQYARLTKHFGGATVRIRLTQVALDSQIARQNTTAYRKSNGFRTYGYVFEGEFAGAFDDKGELPEYKGCPDGCLDYPNWKNVRIVISIKEYDLQSMLQSMNVSQQGVGRVIWGVPQGLNNQDAWVVCIKCDIPEYERELTSGQKVGQAFWVYGFPVGLALTGLAFDRLLDMWTLFKTARERFLNRYVIYGH